MERLSVAVVGMGYWGPNLVRNFATSPHWTVVAAVDSDQQRLHRITTAFPAVKAYTNLDEALRVERVDAVAIATPVETHFDLAKKALLAGKHVFVEKPLTLNSREGEELCRIAAANGLQLMVDHTFLYTGSVELLHKVASAGDLGRILYMDSVRVNLGLFQNNVNVVYDLAPHDISIFNFVLGEYPSEVSAQAGCCIHSDMEDIAFLTLKYPSGVLAHAHLSWLSPVKQRLFTIAGTNRMAIWNDIEPSEKVRIYDKGVDIHPNEESSARRMVSYRTGDMLAPAIDSREALGKAVADFYNAVITGAKTRSTGEDGLAVVRVLECAEQSIAQKGNTIEVLSGAKI